MVLTPETIAVIALAFLLGGLVKGAIGLGMPVVVLALLTPTLGLKVALALMIFPSIASNIWQALAGPALKQLLRRLKTFLAAAIVGTWAGVGILAGASTALLEALLGLLLALYSAYTLLAPRLPEPGRHERWMSPVASSTGGLMFGMTGIFIVPGILYLETLRLGRDRFVQALGITFLTLSTTLGLSMTSHDLVTGEIAAASGGAILPAFAGMWLGQRVRHRISEDAFRRAFFVALFLVGLYTIARTLG